MLKRLVRWIKKARVAASRTFFFPPSFYGGRFIPSRMKKKAFVGGDNTAEKGRI
jgi:hypothetical protein